MTTPLSLREAHRRVGISSESLLAAIADGRLVARGGQREYEPGRLGTRSGWLIEPADLDGFVASAEPCRYPGCEKPGILRDGCCCHAHGLSVRMRGQKRPEVAAKLRAAKLGVSRGPNPPEWNESIADGLGRYYASDRSLDQRRNRAERMSRSWKDGGGAAQATVARATPRTRQVHLGRWGGAKGREAGIEAGRANVGRPAKITPEQALQILELSKEGLSSRPIAERVFGDSRYYKRVLRFLNR
jgi:hypothetical protein